MEYKVPDWNRSALMNCALSKNPHFRYYAQHHMDTTEEIILTAKAVDFIEGFVR